MQLHKHLRLQVLYSEDAVRQKTIFHVSHCAEVQPASWCHHVEDATYRSLGEVKVILQITLLYIEYEITEAELMDQHTFS